VRQPNTGLISKQTSAVAPCPLRVPLALLGRRVSHKSYLLKKGALSEKEKARRAEVYSRLTYNSFSPTSVQNFDHSTCANAHPRIQTQLSKYCSTRYTLSDSGFQTATWTMKPRLGAEYVRSLFSEIFVCSVVRMSQLAIL
jgi:hypothetical protein